MLAASRPTVDWGPAKLEHRRLVDYVPGFVVNPWEPEASREEDQSVIPLRETEQYKISTENTVYTV